MPSPNRAASSTPKTANAPGLELERVDYGRVACLYDLLGWLYTGGQIARLKRRQARRLAPGARVLYAGVGTGEELPSALEARAQVTALDASPAMLERAKNRLGPRAREVQFHCEDLFAHEATQPYDTVVANFFLNVFAEAALPSVLTRLSELVRPGGTLLIGDFAPPALGPRERALQRAYYWAPLALFRLLTQNPWHPLYDYRALTERTGFAQVAHEPLRIFGIGPSWLSTLSFVKAADAS